MAHKKSQDLKNMDWDDSKLIEAYEEAERREKARRSAAKKGKGDATLSDSKWKAGDYCQAIYSEDGLYYEAKIRSTDGLFCFVEFLGYANEEEVSLKTLKDSKGKVARKKQMKKANHHFEYYSTEEEGSNYSCTDSSCVEIPKGRGKKVNMDDTRLTNGTAAYSCPVDETTLNTTRPVPPSNRGHTSSHHVPNMPNRWNEYPVPFHPPHMDMGPGHFPPNDVPYPPFAPPMPQCPESSSASSLSSMLAAWYMAGYYTGLHQGDKKCRKCCCHA